MAKGLFILLVIPLVAQAGSHMRSGGEAFVSTGLSMDLGDRLFDKQEKRISGSCDPGQSLSLYGEYGRSYYTTLFASAALRHQICGSDEKWGLEGGKIGLTRRVHPLSNALVWEAALLLPSQRFGNQSASRNAMGLEVGLHYHPRPNPYDLTLPIDPLEPYWDFGASIKSHFDGLPGELQTYGQYTLPLRKNLWNQGQGGWVASTRLGFSHSLWGAQASTPSPVDSRDTFWRLDIDASLKYALTPEKSLRIGLSHSLAGKNTSESSTISLSYEKTIPK